MSVLAAAVAAGQPVLVDLALVVVVVAALNGRYSKRLI